MFKGQAKKHGCSQLVESMARLFLLQAVYWGFLFSTLNHMNLITFQMYPPVNVHVNPPRPEVSTHTFSLILFILFTFSFVFLGPPNTERRTCMLMQFHSSFQVAPPEQQIASPAPEFNSTFLSSDPDPKFELKGTIFPSAPPLSSDSAFCDVYNSDKLNFL